MLVFKLLTATLVFDRLLIGKSHTLKIGEGVGNCECIMVAHAVYDDVSLPAGTTSEDSPGSSVAIAGHAAGRMAAEGAAGSSG